MSLSELLEPKAIVLQMEAADASDVITRLGGLLNGLGYVRDDFVEATLAREANTPTGLPLGGDFNAALPHVDLEYVKQPAVALATLKEPVVFHNMVVADEEVQVSLVMMLALAEAKSQIEMLQEVATILQRPDVVSRLVAAGTVEDVFAALNGLEIP